MDQMKISIDGTGCNKPVLFGVGLVERRSGSPRMWAQVPLAATQLRAGPDQAISPFVQPVSPGSISDDMDCYEKLLMVNLKDSTYQECYTCDTEKFRYVVLFYNRIG